MMSMSSEEALNKIHDMLGSMMAMYAQQDKDKASGKSEDNVSKLIKGLIDNADNKAAAVAGQQLESLAKGMQELSKIDTTTINSVSASINTINGVINKLQVPSNISESITAFVNAIRKLGDIDADISKNLSSFLNDLNIKNIAQLQQSVQVIVDSVQSLAIISTLNTANLSKNIKDLDPSVAQNLTTFLLKLSEGFKSEIGTDSGIKSVSGVMQALSILSAIDTDKLSKNIKELDPDIARSLTTFLNEMYNGIVVKKDGALLITASKNVMEALELLSKVNMKKVVRNIKRLDPDLAKNITDFVESIIKRFDKIDKAKVAKSLKPINDLLSGISNIISTNVFKMKISLNPIRGWLIGRQIGQFIKAIQDRVQSNKNIPESIKYIGDILKPLADLADPKNKFSVFKLMKVLSTSNAKKIAGFFNALGTELKASEKNTAEAMRALTELIKVIDKFEYFSSIRFAINMRLLDMRGARRLNRFISTIMDGDWDYKRVREMRKFVMGLILTFTSALAMLAATVALAGPGSVLVAFGVLHYGMKSIKNTIQDLINGENGIGNQDMKHAVEILNQMGKTTAIMTGLIAGIAVLTDLVGMTNLLFGLGILHLTLTSVSVFIKKLNEQDISKQTVEALKAVKSMKDLILSLTGSVIALTILSKYSSLEDMAIGVGIITVLLAVSSLAIISLTKWAGDKRLKQASEAMSSIGKLIGMITLSITALTLLVRIFSPEEVWQAVGIVTVISAVMGGIVIGLTHWVKPKNLKQANDTLKALTKMLLGITATIGLLSYIVKTNDEKTIYMALGIIGGVLLAMTGIVILLGKSLDQKELKWANITLGVLTGVLLGVSIITNSILIPIGRRGGNAIMGAVVTLGIVTALVGLTKWVTTFEEKELKNALITIGVLTTILLAVSLITENLLIPIGKHWKDALIGVGVTTLVMAGLVGLTKWFTTFDNKELTESLKAIGVLTGILLVVSLTIKYLLIPIGEQAKEALFGTAIAMAVVTGMIGLTKWLSTFDDKKLYETYKTLGILTAELLIISLTIKYLLIPIGETAKEALFGSAIALAVVTGMLGLVKWIMTFDEKELYESYKALGILTAELLVISLTIRYILTPIGEQAKEALFGSAIAMAVVTGMLGLVKWMMTFDEQKLSESYKALGILTAELLVISLTIKYILSPIGEQAKEALFGSAIAMGVVVGMISLVKWMMSFDEQKLSESYKALGILTAELLVISLTIKYILSPIGESAKEAFLGSAITLGVVMALVGIVRLLMSFDEKDMKTSYLALAILTAELLVISLTLKQLIVPIGENAESALYGTAIILATVLGMVGISWILSKIEQKDLTYSLVAIGVLTLILGLVSLTAKYLLIPIGQQAGDALKGAAIAVGLVTLMTGIVYVLGKLISKGGKELELGMIKGALVMAASIGLIYLLGKGIQPLIEASKMVGEDPKKIAIGGAIIMGAVGVITLAMIGIGQLVKNPMVALATAIGGAVLWGAIELLDLLGNTVLKFTDVIDKVKKYDTKTLKEAGIGIGIVLGIMGETLIGVVALSGPALLAGAVAGPLYGVTTVIFNILNQVSDEILKLNDKITTSDIKKFNTLIYDKTKKDNPDTLIGSFHNIINGFRSLGFWNSVIATITSQVIKPIIDTISKYVDVVLKVATGHYVIGYDDNGRPIYERIPDGAFRSAAEAVNVSFAEFLEKLNEGFSKLGMGVKLFGALYARTLNPIIKLVGKFVDIVLKVATGTYIIGYDDNGKPEYKHLTAKEFGDAGTQVSVQFAIFLKMLNEGFKSLEAGSILAMKTMQWILFPIINHVGRFVDIVLKVATANYVTGYDENGKPEYTHLTDQDFAKAGTAVSTQFALFITSLGTAFDSLTDNAIDAMKSVKKAMGPIMDTLSKFVDAVIKVASGQYVSGYDKNGKPEFTKIEIEDFTEAGSAVAYTFGEFIRSLDESFKNMNEDTQDAIKSIGKSLKPIMEGVQNYIEAILKFATGQYVSGFQKDKNGNYTVPILTKLTNEELLDAGKKVAEMFSYFVTSITNSFDKGSNLWGSKTEDALEAIGGSIGPIMDSLSTYVDAIMKVATGTYTDGYIKDKDGKLLPNFKHLKPSDFSNAAVQVAKMFVSFINTLINKFSNEQFKEKAENLQDVINESIKPIMDSVKSFSDALKPFLDIKQQKTNAKGDKVNEYLAFKPGAIKQVADDIANGFASFINIIYNEVFSEEKQKNFKAIKKNAKNVNEVLDIIKKSAASLSKIIKQFQSSDDKDVNQKSIDAAHSFNNIMTVIVDYYNDPAHDFEGAVAPAQACLTLMKVVKDVASKYSEIIRKVQSLNDKDTNITELTKLFNTNMLSMANNVVNVYGAIQNIEFSKLYELISAYAMLSLKYVELSRLVNEDPYVSQGLTKLSVNISKLADDELRANISATTVSINKYALNVGKFTTSIEKSTKSVQVYTTTLEKARKTLEKLDQQIIGKAKEREKALQNLADKINNIATAVDNLRTSFEALDENAIISRFDGLRELLELAGVISKSEQGEKAEKNKTQSQTRAQSAAAKRPADNRAQGSNNTYNYGFNGARSGHVTFQFANTILDGTFRST